MTIESHQKDTYELTGGTPTSTTLATLVAALRAAADPTVFGIDCTNSRGVNAVFSVNSSKTIVSGTMRAFCLMPCDVNGDRSIPSSGRRWVYCPNLDVTLVGGSTERDEASDDLSTPVGAYRLAFVPDAVIGSSGSTSLGVTYSTRRWGI